MSNVRYYGIVPVGVFRTIAKVTRAQMWI